MLDPLGKEVVGRTDYEDVLEKLARGKITETPTILSNSYVGFVGRKLAAHECVEIENGRLLIPRLREALLRGEIGIDVFNKPLWNEIEELDF